MPRQRALPRAAAARIARLGKTDRPDLARLVLHLRAAARRLASTKPQAARPDGRITHVVIRVAWSFARTGLHT